MAGALGAVLTFATTQSIPARISQADTVLATNAHWLGWKDFPPALASQAASHLAGVGGGVLLLFALGVLVLALRERFFAKDNPSRYTMPLSAVVQHVADKTSWGRRFKSEGRAYLEQDWRAALRADVLRPLCHGELSAYGMSWRPFQDREGGPSKIPEDWWKSADFNTVMLYLGEQNHAWELPTTGGTYSRIMLRPDEVEKLWPSRNWIARKLFRSPVPAWVTAIRELEERHAARLQGIEETFGRTRGG